ncbi:hypothetical protein [Streptomyces sp. TLI_55]|uniref:hypothetical protein n=1 Tax=Streptomyces sp. TLI_55 TaxID=1938861 RepID=UPI000BE33F10|nr:hypothetical protein [Streptomyces sp. TLI_55]
MLLAQVFPGGALLGVGQAVGGDVLQDGRELIGPGASLRGDLLARLGRTAEAREEFLRTAGLARNERELLLGRAAACET